ncbi:polycystic kidney disease protein 1-like 2 [Anneissia japonica]|uniref:polycystic kidney disease protein 1-like 2 n=1 Tax=Anneissia japonica TaxID=1529436 RepID=UPI0014259DAE|nr:polycystic kidney disease protein 1-like 2 [Anneissia japonica]
MLENRYISHTFSQPGSYLTLTSCLTSQGIVDRRTTVVVDKIIDYVDCWIDGESFLKNKEALYMEFQTLNIDTLRFYVLIDGNYFKDDNLLNTLQPLQDHNDMIVGYVTIPTTIQKTMLPGEHTLSLTFYNNLHGRTCNRQFILVEPITNMVIQLSKKYVAAGDDFTVEVSADGGYPANITWTVVENESSNLTWKANTVRVGKTSRDLNFIQLALKTPGTYTVEADIMEITQVANITVQYPVPQVSMVTNSPLHFPAHDVIMLTITFGHPDILPSSPFYSVTFGEACCTQITAIPEDVQTFNISQVLGPGLYTVTLDIYNEVSHVRTLGNVAVLQDISNIIIHSYKDGSSVPSAILPVEYPIFFELEVTGTAQQVEWEFNGQLAITSTTHHTWKFDAIGYNNISVKVSNAFSSDWSSIQVDLLNGITDVFLVNNGPVMLTENITFILFLKHIGTGSSFTLDTGDGNLLIWDLPVKQTEVINCLPSGLNLPFEPTKYYSSILHHQYLLDGKYTANATAQNFVTTRTDISTAFVQLRPCLLPEIHIRDGISDSNISIQYERSHNILFSRDIKWDCQESIGPRLTWKVFKISGAFSIPDPTNEYHLPPSIKTSLTEIFIPSFTLEYGHYIFELTVTMVLRDGSLGISNSDNSMLEVVETPFVARILGGSLIVIGWYNNITIDGSDSYDPDSPTPNFNYNWFCRLMNETFPDDVISLIDKKASSGGCFQEGLYVNSGSQLFIPAQTLEGNQTFVIRLVITEPGRKSVHTEQTIFVSPGNPPSIGIRCLMNCDTFLNPSERFILSGKCGDCTEYTRPAYQWYLIPGSPDNVNQVLAWGHDTTTSQFNAYLSIHANVFEAAKSETYTLRLKIKSWSGASSYSEFTFSTNSRPSLGTCTADPTEGYVLSTLFAISCLGFHDDDLPLHYVVHAVTGAEKMAGVSSLKDSSDEGSLLNYGVEPVFPLTLLPIGLKENNYMVKINVKVLDTYGAYIDTFISVKVMPPPPASIDIEDAALNLTSSKDSKLEQLLEDGDTQSAVQLITTVSSILNAEAEKSHSERDPSEHGQHDQVQERDEQNAEKKQKRTEIREAIIENIKSVEIRDLESLQQTSAAIAQVTQEKDEITDKAQRSAANAFVNMGSYLKEQSSVGAGGEVVEVVARFIMSGVSNIMAKVTTLSPSEGEDQLASTNQVANKATEKRSQDRNVTLVSLNALDQVKSAIFVNKVPGEEPTYLQTDTVSVVLQKQEKWDLDGLVFNDRDSGISFRLPDNVRNAVTGSEDQYDEVISLQMNNFKQNPFIWDESSASVTSQVCSLELTRAEGAEVDLQDLSENINIFIANPTQLDTVAFLQGIYIDNTTTTLTYGFNVTSNVGSVVILVNPSNISQEMTLYLRYELPPNGTQYDRSMHFPLSTRDVIVNWNVTTNLTGNTFTWVINVDEISGAGSYFVSVETQNSDDNYTVAAFMATCLYWNMEFDQWSSDGCQVGVLSTANRLHCQCSHLSFFGGNFFVLPNTINLVEDAKLFRGFLDNPIVIIAVIIVFSVQAFCFILARRKDKSDHFQAHVTILQDNDPVHEHRYHVTIFTGMRTGAGTSAVVTLTLYGMEGNSEPHVMTSLTRKVMCQGTSDSFLLTTKESLGDLSSVRVWHDNSGSHPAWYLSRILVHEVDSDQWWYFLCKTWLAVDIGDCIIDKTFYAATEDELHLFQNIFLIKSMQDIRDGHLWFSVITRPPRSNFTSLQRIACCFNVLLTTMLTSIMFYGIPDDPEAQDLDFGKFQISWKDIVIGLECSILVFPINFLTVTLFRNVRSRPDETTVLEIEGISDNKADNSSSSLHSDIDSNVNDSSLSSSSSVDLKEVVINSENQSSKLNLTSSQEFFSSLLKERQQSPTDDDFVGGRLDDDDKLKSMPSGAFVKKSVRKEAVQNPKSNIKQRPECYLVETTPSAVSDESTNQDGCFPWWMIYLAWLVLFLCEGMSAYAIMLYGLKFGKQKSMDWLVSILVSFFSNVIVVQPVKMFVVAAIVSLVFKAHKKEDVGVQFFKNLHIVKSDLDVNGESHSKNHLKRKSSMKHYRPPTTQAVKIAREKRQAEAKMHVMIRSFIGQLILMWLVMEIAYTQRDPNSFFLNNIIQTTFTDGLNTVSSFVDLFNWLEGAAVPAWFNKDSSFLRDTSSVIASTVRLRQLRVLPDSCPVATELKSTLKSGCASPLYKTNMDRTSNAEPWSSSGVHIPGQDIWSFQHRNEVKGSYYIGHLQAYDRGGYVAELRINESASNAVLTSLQKSKWLDEHTRAVFIEWTMYNVDVNLFCVCTLLFEVPGTGSLMKSSEFLVMKLYRFTSKFQVFVLVLELAYIAMLIFMIYKEVTRFYQRGYDYFNTWSVLTLFIIILSLTAIVLYSVRQVLANDALARMKANNQVFSSFYEVAITDQLLGYVIASIVFCTTLKSLKFLRFNNSIFLMSSTIHKISNKLFSVTCMLFTAMFSFAVYSYLVFGSMIYDFNNLISCLQNIVGLMLGRAEVMEEVYYYYPFFGAVFSFLVTFAMIYLLLNAFISLLLDGFSDVKGDFVPCPDKDIIAMLVDRLLSVLAIRRKTATYNSEKLTINI